MDIERERLIGLLHILYDQVPIGESDEFFVTVLREVEKLIYPTDYRTAVVDEIRAMLDNKEKQT